MSLLIKVCTPCISLHNPVLRVHSLYTVYRYILILWVHFLTLCVKIQPIGMVLKEQVLACIFQYFNKAVPVCVGRKLRNRLRNLRCITMESFFIIKQYTSDYFVTSCLFCTGSISVAIRVHTITL